MKKISNREQKLPLVSIVTPTYNQAEYLEETIQSVLSQTYKNIEYIVLDDGSTDNTQEVLSRFNGRIRCKSHSNVGQAKTLNRGWAMSRGSILGYLSSDDLLNPNAIERLVETFIQQPEVPVVYCDYDLIDAKGRIFRRVKTEDFDVNRLIIDLVCQPGPGALFRREVFEDLGGWNEALRQVPDFEFWLRASRFGHFCRIPEALARYRVHKDSASFRPISSERSVEIIKVMVSYWGGVHSMESNRSIATARLVSCKSHFQSGRLKDGFEQLINALCSDKSKIFNINTWRLIGSGLFRRLFYYLNKRDQ